MAPRVRSPLWHHFENLLENRARCKYCSKIVKTTGGSLGNLGRHLKTKHPAIITDARPDVNRDTGTDIIEVDIDVDQPTQGKADHEISHSRPEESQPEAQPSTSSSSAPRKRTPKQQSLQQYIHKPVSSTKSRALDIQLIKMIAKEYHPLSLVEDPEFKKLINMLCPGYSLPSRKTVSKTLIPQLYLAERERLKVQLQTADAICLTTDSWTSINNDAFTAVTAHFFDEHFQLTTGLLDCVKFEDRHTAENIAAQLIAIVKDYGIENRIAACITDNAANELAAIRICGWRHLACFAHCLNLVVQKSLQDISQTITRVKSVVEYFRRSSFALSRLNLTQEQMNLPKLKLTNDVVTRWNSTYDMLNRINQIKTAVISTLAVLQNDLQFSITNEDWCIIDRALEILKIFQDITTEISAEKNVSVSKIIPLTKIIKKKIEVHLAKANDPETPNEIKLMLMSLDKNMNARFKNIEDTELTAQATILDPRFKKYGFLDDAKYSTAFNNLKKKLSSVQLLSCEQDAEREIPVHVSVTGSDIWEDFDEEVRKICGLGSTTAAAIIELDKYVGEPLLPRQENPLKWWKDRAKVYPRLFQLTKRRLCITATSVPCERIFSKAGQILTDRRNRLSSKKVQELIFLKQQL